MSCLRAKPKSTSLTLLWLLVSVTSTLSKANMVHAESIVSFLTNFAHSNLNSSSNVCTKNVIIALSDRKVIKNELSFDAIPSKNCSFKGIIGSFIAN